MSFKDSKLSWSVDKLSLNQDTWDLSAKNPNANDQILHQSPAEIFAEIETLETQNQEILQRIKSLI